MQYFFDTEFHEGFKKPLFGRRYHFIDFISIGIVAEDGREYYAISRDFDIKAAWNAYQIKQLDGDGRNRFPDGIKEYWLRENVLKPLYHELIYREYWEDPNEMKEDFYALLNKVQEDKRLDFFVKEMLPHSDSRFTYTEFKRLIKKYGKSNGLIAEEIRQFCLAHYPMVNPEFYAYFADYDWVVFCSLFGKMINLPKGFPYYCRDLKQSLDEKIATIDNEKWAEILDKFGCDHKKQDRTGIELMDWSSNNFKQKLVLIKSVNAYPQQENEHNALADARWNKKLYRFIIDLSTKT